MEQLTIFDILDNTSSDDLTEAEIVQFSKRLKFMVNEAVQFLGREKEFDDSTRISVFNVNTSKNNKYFPAGCAMAHIRLLSDTATGTVFLSNKYALTNRLDWVEDRHYDHRYFKKYNHEFTTHDWRLQPHIVTLESYKQSHFRGELGGIYFGNTGRIEYSIQRIKDFLEWDF